jgi:hypothetical protein
VVIIPGQTVGHSLGTAAEELNFVRADSDLSGAVDISDPITTLQALFVGGAAPLLCEDAADSNDDGAVDISDPIHTLTFLFLGGTEPAPPYPERGRDDTPEDGLRCAPRPQAGRWVVAIRPHRCPQVACDPWVGDPAAASSPEDHLRAFEGWVRSAGATVTAGWTEISVSADNDYEDFEIVAIVDGSEVAPRLLAARRRLIQAPPGVMELSMLPYQCGFTIWECDGETGDVDRSHEELFAEWAARFPGTTIYSMSREPLPGPEDTGICDCEGCRLGFRFNVVLEGESLLPVLISSTYGRDLDTEVRYPAAKILRASLLACPVEPWAVWYLTEHGLIEEPRDLHDDVMLAGWMAAMGEPVYLAFSTEFVGGQGPSIPDCGDPTQGSIWAVVPRSSSYLESIGFAEVTP